MARHGASVVPAWPHSASPPGSVTFAAAGNVKRTTGLPSTTNFTVQFRVRGLPSGNSNVFSFGATGGGDAYGIITNSNSVRLTIGVNLGTFLFHRFSAWYVITLKVFGSGAGQLNTYVNGINPGFSLPGNHAITGTQMTFGGVPGDLWNFTSFGGQMSNAMVWSRALTDAEILLQAQIDRPVIRQSLYAWLPMLDHASAGVDWSGNNNHFTKTGTNQGGAPPPPMIIPRRMARAFVPAGGGIITSASGIGSTETPGAASDLATSTPAGGTSEERPGAATAIWIAAPAGGTSEERGGASVDLAATTPSGIGSTEQPGAAVDIATSSPVGSPSTESPGAASVAVGVALTSPSGEPTRETPGATVSFASSSASGARTEESPGAAAAVVGLITTQASGAPSTERPGAPASSSASSASGGASGEAPGAAGASVALSPASSGTEERTGATLVIASASPSGCASAESPGSPTVAASAFPPGARTTEMAGAASVLIAILAQPSGVPSEERAGAAVLLGPGSIIALLPAWMVGRADGATGNALLLGATSNEAIMEPFPIGQGARLPAIRTQFVGDDGAIPDLTGATVVFRLLKDDVLIFERPAIIEGDPTQAIVRYEWAAGDTDVAGAFDAEWIVTFSDGRQETFPPDRYNRVRIKPRRH